MFVNPRRTHENIQIRKRYEWIHFTRSNSQIYRYRTQPFANHEWIQRNLSHKLKHILETR